MTDNEKAATFIGWKAQIGTIVTGATGPYVQQWEYAAPDMADPRNYMKALEIMDGWHSNVEEETGVRDVWLGHKREDIYVYGGGLTFADAVIAALAALYDAEHPG